MEWFFIFVVVARILFSTTEPIEHNSIAKLIFAKWFWGMWSCIKRGPMNMLHGWRFVHQNARSKHYVCLDLCISVSFSFFSGSFSFYFQYYKINIFGFYSVLFFSFVAFLDVRMLACLFVLLVCGPYLSICVYILFGKKLLLPYNAYMPMDFDAIYTHYWDLVNLMRTRFKFFRFCLFIYRFVSFCSSFFLYSY